MWFDTSFDCNFFHFRQVTEKCHPFSSVFFWYGIVPMQFRFICPQFSHKYFSSYCVRTGKSKKVIYTVHLRQNYSLSQYAWNNYIDFKVKIVFYRIPHTTCCAITVDYHYANISTTMLNLNFESKFYNRTPDVFSLGKKNQ